jgi:hypothetical protein
MARILRATNPQSPRTPRGVISSARSGSWHDESQLTRRTTKSKKSVRRLFATDPTVSNTFSPVYDQFTNNLNPRYDPSRAPGSVRKLDGTPVPPQGNPNAGHQRVIRFNNQMRTGGKRLVRSPAGGYIRKVSTG